MATSPWHVEWPDCDSKWVSPCRTGSCLSSLPEISAMYVRIWSPFIKSHEQTLQPTKQARCWVLESGWRWEDGIWPTPQGNCVPSDSSYSLFFFTHTENIIGPLLWASPCQARTIQKGIKHIPCSGATNVQGRQSAHRSLQFSVTITL